MKAIYVIGGAVVGIASVPVGQNAIPSGPAGSTEYTVADNDPTQIGWNCTIVNGQPSFSAPVPSAPVFAPGSMEMSQFWVSMTAQERAALRAHKDPLVVEFVATCTDPRFTTINTALPGVQFDVNYAAGLVVAPPGAANAGQLITNPPILNGSVRAPQILSGNYLAAGN